MQNIVPCLYLCIAFGFGYQISEALLNETKIQKKIAEGIGIGYMAAGWVTYLCCYILKVYCKIQHPKPYANIFTITLLVFLCVYLKLYNKEKNIKNKNTGISEILAFTALFLFILWTMFYVFHAKSGIISSGVTVYSDFSPHTAMIRSFSYHDNFPTQYPHYGGEDVKYHFMFQFMAGNLEYLGLPIDWAFNLISAAALWGFLVLLYEFAKKITGCNAGGWLTILLFFCRSSFAGIEKILTTIISGEWDGFLTNTSFIGYTAHEDWGLWNYNVFLNQRHLGFGLLIGMIAITYFYDRLDWLDISKKECLCRVKTSDGNTPWFNGEREIPGRQKVVRGSNVQVLTSHASLNPRSKSGYEREARVIKTDEPVYQCEQPFIDERSDERDIDTNVKKEFKNPDSSIYNTLPYEIPGFAVDEYKPNVETCSNNDCDLSSSWNAGLTKSCNEITSSDESSMESDNDSGKTGELANTEQHGDDLNNNYDELKTLIKSIVEEVLCDIGVYPKCLKEKTSHKDPCSPLEHLHSDENESNQKLPENDTCTDDTLKQTDNTEDVIKRMMNEEKLAAAEEEELDFIPRRMQPPFEFNFDNSDLNLEDNEEDDISIKENNGTETDSETNE